MSARVPLITLICPYKPCSKPFEVHPRIVRSAERVGKKRYCSPECGKLGSIEARRTSVTLLCDYPPCGKPFQTYASTLARGFKARYCSANCRARGVAARRFPGTFAERFWAQVFIGRPDECWPWQGRTRHDGYGVLYVPETQLEKGAHIVSWYFAHGRWPAPGMDICHSCDNHPCVNPAHLWEGTPLENTLDSVQKGRWPSGERHWKSKLTDTQWQEILQLLAEGTLSKRIIAAQYNVSVALITDRLRDMRTKLQ